MLTVKEGEIVTLIGANGAGKSTPLNTISGLVRISSGEVRFFDQRMDRLPPHQILALGSPKFPRAEEYFRI
jgi:branched-chain amino acid transport system ATP-binding protein